MCLYVRVGRMPVSVHVPWGMRHDGWCHTKPNWLNIEYFADRFRVVRCSFPIVYLRIFSVAFHSAIPLPYSSIAGKWTTEGNRMVFIRSLVLSLHPTFSFYFPHYISNKRKGKRDAKSNCGLHKMVKSNSLWSITATNNTTRTNCVQQRAPIRATHRISKMRT